MSINMEKVRPGRGPEASGALLQNHQGDCLSREGGIGSETRAEKSSWERGLGHWQENQCLASPDCYLVPGTLPPLSQISSVPAVDTTLPLLSLKLLCQGRITKR